MIYNIYYCVSNDKCFGWPADQELKNVFGNNGKDLCQKFWQFMIQIQIL